MAVAFDAATEGVFTTENPMTLVHTPAGTPRGVVVKITRQSSSLDVVSGVTYGGVAMTRIQTAADDTTEAMRSWTYFLGSGIPTGAQTVSIAVTGTAGTKHVVAITVTAAADTLVAASGIVQEDTADPAVALDSGADTALRLVALVTGHNDPANVALRSGMTLIHDHDFGGQYSSVARQTTPSAGSFTIGYTAAIDDTALVAIAVKEVATVSLPNFVNLPGAPGDYVDTPDAAAFDITGDLELAVLADIAAVPEIRHQNLITKGNPGDVAGSYIFRVQANSRSLRLGWRTAAGLSVGVTSSPDIAIAGVPRWYRATLDVDNGAAGHTVTFYYSDDPVGTALISWTQHSQHIVAGTTSISAGTAAVVVGNRDDNPDEALRGKVYWSTIRAGVNLVGGVDYRDAAQKTGPQQFTDSSGNVWTLRGNATWQSEVGTGGTALTVTWRPFDFVTYYHRGSASQDFIIELLPFDFVLDGPRSTTTTTTGGVTIPWRPFDLIRDGDRWLLEVEVTTGPPPPPPPLPVLGTEDILSSFSLSIRVGLELLDQDDRLLADISDDLETGVVARNMNATIHGTARLRISRAINWHNQRLRPYLVATELITNASERFDLGIYLPETPSRSTGRIPATYDVEAYDKLVILDHPHGIAHTVAAGAGVVATVESILDDRGVSHALDQTSAATVPSARSWPLEAENTTLRIINDLLASINYRALYVDRTGIFRSEPYRAPAERAPVWHYDASSPRTIIGEVITEEIDLFAIPNYWVFVRDDPAQDAPAEGNGIYTVVNSTDGISSIAARGRVITKVERIDAADHASLVAAGNQIVQRDRQPFAHLSFSAVPNPLHWHADSVTVTSAELGLAGVIFGEQSWSVPLDGGDMTHEVRRSVPV